MIYLDVIVTIIAFQLAYLTYLVVDTQRPYKHVEDSAPQVADEHHAESTVDVDPFSEEEIKRKKEFNERIARIKDELARENSKRMNKSTESAESLHPDVYNLPHDSIPTSTIPDVEYAD